MRCYRISDTLSNGGRRSIRNSCALPMSGSLFATINRSSVTPNAIAQTVHHAALARSRRGNADCTISRQRACGCTSNAPTSHMVPLSPTRLHCCSTTMSANGGQSSLSPGHLVTLT